MIFDKKATIIENQVNMNFEGHQLEIIDAVKVLGVIIDDQLSFCQQNSAATNGAIQTFGSIRIMYWRNQSISPNTFKILCQSIVIPKWIYLAFIWRVVKSSETLNSGPKLSTCSI